MLGLVAAAAIVAAVTAPLRHEAASEARREAARQATTEAAEIRRLRADAVPHRGTGPPRRAGEDVLARRRALVDRAEALITRDAQARTRAGTLSGSIAGTDCEPYPGITVRRQAEADPSVTVGRYECIAFQRQVELPELEGKQAPRRARLPLLGGDRLQARGHRLVQGHAARRRGRALARVGPGPAALPGPAAQIALGSCRGPTSLGPRARSSSTASRGAPATPAR